MNNKLNEKILKAIGEIVKDQEEYQVGYEVKHHNERKSTFSKEPVEKIYITIEITKLL